MHIARRLAPLCLLVGAFGTAACSGLPRPPSPATAREMIVGQPAIPRVDLILVHGCPARPDGTPSTCNQRRVQAAMRAYREGRAPYVMFTGGAVLNQHAEARVMAQYAAAQGLPESAILTEEESRHTVTNLSVAKGIMKRRGMKTVLLVSESMHLVWAKQLADFYRMRTWLYPADMLPPYTDAYQSAQPWDELEPWKTQTGAYGKPLPAGPRVAVDEGPRSACILVGDKATIAALQGPLSASTQSELQLFEWRARGPSRPAQDELSLWIRAWTEGWNGPVDELVVVVGAAIPLHEGDLRVQLGQTTVPVRFVRTGTDDLARLLPRASHGLSSLEPQWRPHGDRAPR